MKEKCFYCDPKVRTNCEYLAYEYQQSLCRTLEKPKVEEKRKEETPKEIQHEYDLEDQQRDC